MCADNAAASESVFVTVTKMASGGSNWFAGRPPADAKIGQSAEPRLMPQAIETVVQVVASSRVSMTTEASKAGHQISLTRP